MNEHTKTENFSPYFSIVIPAYNEEDHIGSCLQSIFNSNYDSTQYEVIVVDNGSQDKTYEIALNFKRARVFQLLEGNVGAVRNYGAYKAQGEILVFIDADCLLDDNWLKRAEGLIRKHPNCAYGGGAKLPNNSSWIETAWLLQNKGNPTLPKHLIGASTMMSSELFFCIGGFDELVSSGEDTELHSRLIKDGIPVLIDNALSITHLGNAKTLRQFINRQIWHSENYAKNIKASMRDPIFYAVLGFIFIPFLVLNYKNIPLGLNFGALIITWLAIPALLSLKRLFRSGFFTINLKKLTQIYILDFLYLIARSIGLAKGVFFLSK
ncbi:MAG: glycosyltransferase family 2 protein [Alteromonadaceae bacterium]|nr:glycosyltransferase family 2 protein [Alteromonadaceae bacterium]